MKKPTLASAIETIRESVKGIEGAEVNICEDKICLMYSDHDIEFNLYTGKDLTRLARAIMVIEEYK